MKQLTRMERIHAREVELQRKVSYQLASDEEWLEYRELRCITVIHTGLVNDIRSRATGRVLYPFEEWFPTAIRYVEDLGAQRVRDLFVQEVAYFQTHAVITPKAYQGPEGEWYPSVTYRA